MSTKPLGRITDMENDQALAADQSATSVAIRSVARNRKMNAGIRALSDIASLDMTAYRRQIVGAAMMPESRNEVNRLLSSIWDRAYISRYDDYDDRELVIGSGITAAIYSAARVRQGYRRPIVVDMATPETIGGAFAYSLNPVFYLNSRNRAGKLALPGEGGALNYLPGAVIQPADLSNSEYQTNADLAWIIRVTLGQFAQVYPQFRVTSVEPEGNGMRVEMTSPVYGDRSLRFGRVIDATGLGEPRDISRANGTTVLTYPQFMARMGTMLPLRDLDRVAVLGSGDSAKTAVEALLGIGPTGQSLASVTTLTRVDLYARSLPDNREDWQRRIRGRYLGIAQFLRRSSQETSSATRLTVIPTRSEVEPTYNGVLISGRTYDMAVLCTGYEGGQLRRNYGRFSSVGRGTGIGKQYSDYPWYVAGPSAALSLDDGEYSNSTLSNMPENSVGIFRYASRTAALATRLGPVGDEIR